MALVAWWKMAGNLNDSSGNGYTSTNNGATLTSDRFGNANSSYSFNGSSSYVTINTALPTSVSTFTITAWVYPLSFNQSSSGGGVGGTILNADNDGNADGYDLGIRNTNKIWWWPQGGQDLFSTASISLNVWTHIAIAVNGATTTIYINGALDSTQTSAAAQVPTFLQIGSSCHITGYWYGSLDDIRIYSTTLSANNVKQVYQQFNQASNFFSGV
jgi:hypothetical protein